MEGDARAEHLRDAVNLGLQMIEEGKAPQLAVAHDIQSSAFLHRDGRVDGPVLDAFELGLPDAAFLAGLTRFEQIGRAQ